MWSFCQGAPTVARRLSICSLTTIAPGVATADPLRIVPYIDMVFSPTIVPWLCLTGVKETMSDISNVDEVRAFNHLPVIESAELAGCPRPKFWDDWFDHQQDDAYWRAHLSQYLAFYVRSCR